MNKVIRKAALMAAATFSVSAFAPSAASAAEFYFGGGNSQGSIGNVRTFTGNDGTKVEATAYSRNGNSLVRGAVGWWSTGLGVINEFPNWWGNGGDNSHTIDNSGYVDIIVLQFDKVVTISKVGVFGYGDTDLSYAVGSTDTAFSDTLSIANWTAMDNLFEPFQSSTGNNSNSYKDRSVNGDEVSGNLFFVSAALWNSQSNDSFKLKSLQYSVAPPPPPPPPPPPVPEPATWAMMIGGLGMVGASMRRRKSKASVDFA